MYVQQQEGNSDRVEKLKSSLPIFASLVVLRDAFIGFGDRFAFLESYQFMLKPSIFARVDQLLNNVDVLQSRYPEAKMIFDQECKLPVPFTTPIEKENMIVTLKSCVSILFDKCASVLVTHTSQTLSNDRLIAASLATLANVPDAYIINAFNGSLERIYLRDTQQFFVMAIRKKTDKSRPLSDEEFLARYKPKPRLCFHDSASSNTQYDTQDEEE